MGGASAKHGRQGDDGTVIQRRAALARIFQELPPYASDAFWEAVAGAGLPLEVLVSCVRFAVNQHDEHGRNRLLECIVGRIQASNEEWASKVLQRSIREPDECAALVGDLCADLYESLFRSLMDPTRLFWEENFWHCMRFERKHVYSTLLVREGRWSRQQVKKADRIPRSLLARLQQLQHAESEGALLELEDEKAQKKLIAVEHVELRQQVLQLPDKLKTVVLLIFWEGMKEKEIAQVLGVTDRTVRNRMSEALHLLRSTWRDTL